jgi:ribosomal protein S18 acetylase RimI-like enzyme
MIDYFIYEKTINKEDILELLFYYDAYFIPKISDRINLEEYSKKLASNATFILAKKEEETIGFAAFYFNPIPQSTYITLLAVDYNFQRLGIGKSLVKKITEYCYANNSAGILLEMRADDSKLFKFYSDLGFKIKDKFESPLNGEAKYHMYLTLSKTLSNE